MTEINVTVNEYGEVYLSSNILGIRGENNARVLIFDAPSFENCTYEVWFDVGDENPYSSLIINGKCVVPASVLVNDTVSLQWVAVRNTELMAKSNVWEMKVLESLDDDTLPAPTYEQAQTVLEEILGILPDGGNENDILVKQSGNNTAWQSLDIVAENINFSQAYLLDWNASPTDAQKSANITAVKSYATARFPKTMLLRMQSDGSTKYLSLSGLVITGTLYECVFSGSVSGGIPILTAKKITVNVQDNSYNQYSFDTWNYFQDTDKSKLATIEESAEVNVIETIKVNGSAASVFSKAVDISVPTSTAELTNNSGFITWQSLIDYYTKTQTDAAIDNAINEITNGDEVSY